MADGLTQGLRKVDGKEVALNCALAVDNIRSQIETMLDNGRKNLKGGYITQAQYDSTTGHFVKLRSQATVATARRPRAARAICTNA